MTTVFPVLAAILLVFVSYTVMAPLALNARRFVGKFHLTCPNRGEVAEVKVRAARAALSSAYGSPRIMKRRCSLLRQGETCNEACLKELTA
jgi:hypothetical protein